MNRRLKYPTTSTFVYHNANPKDRITGDCVVRAICTALDEDYNEVVMDLAKLQIETGYDSLSKEGYSEYLSRKGWIKHPQLKHSDKTKYTGKQFCRWLNSQHWQGNVFCHIGGHHVVAIKPAADGKYKVFDIWDSTDGCVGNWWSK